MRRKVSCKSGKSKQKKVSIFYANSNECENVEKLFVYLPNQKYQHEAMMQVSLDMFFSCLLIIISFLWIEGDIVDVVGVFRVVLSADLMNGATDVVVDGIVVCGISEETVNKNSDSIN